MLKPVHKVPLSEVVYDQLRAQILGGELEPGAALPSERALCEILKVHRGAVREALKRLHQARLIKVQHGGTTRVLDYRATAGSELLQELLISPNGTLDVGIVRGMIEMRAALGPDIARLCAMRGGDKAVAALEQIVRAMADAGGDPRALHRLTLAFWEALIDGSGNVPYRLVFNSFRQLYAKVEDTLSHLLLDELSDLAAYRAISDAVAAADGPTARDLASRLIQRGADRLLQLLEMIERMSGGPKP